MCGEAKPEGEFYLRTPRNPNTSGRRPDCKPCSIASRRTVKEKRTPQEFREAYLKSKFGITQADYDAMFERQAGACAICQCPAEQSYKGLHIDHDHITGRVRGLLCQRCNMALGLLGDDVDTISKAAAYIAHPS